MLKLKNFSNLTAADTINYRQLSIGLQAYRDWLIYRLEALTETMAYDPDECSVMSSSDELVSIIIPEEIINDAEYIGASQRQVIAAMPVRHIADMLHEGDAEGDTNITIQVINDVGDAIDVGITAEQALEAITTQVEHLQGQIVLYSVAVREGLSNQFSITALNQELATRGYQPNSFIISLAGLVSNGVSWANVLSFIGLSTDRDPDDDSPYAYSFKTSAFSDSNALVMGVTSILSGVMSFFEDINFSLTKIGDFFKQVFDSMGRLVNWVVEKLFHELAVDYTAPDNPSLRAFDIPFSMIRWNDGLVGVGAYSTSSIIGDDLETANSPYRFSISHPTEAVSAGFAKIFPSDVDPEGVRLRLKRILPVGESLIFPNPEGFTIMTCTREVPSTTHREYEIYYFLGAHSLQLFGTMLRTEIDPDDGSYIISGLHDNLGDEFDLRENFCHMVPQPILSDNEAVGNYVLNCIDPTADPGVRERSFDLTQSRSGVSGWWCSSEDPIPVTFNIPENPSPVDFVDAFSTYDYLQQASPSDTKLRATLTMNAVWSALCYASDDLTHFNLVATYGVPTTSTHVFHLQNFETGAFAPYLRNNIPVFEVHSQDDAERSDEAKAAIIKVLVTAAVAYVGVKLVKGYAGLRRKAFKAGALADKAARELTEDSPVSEVAMAMKLRRKASLLKSVTGVFTGVTAGSVTQQALSSYKSISTDADRLIAIERLITG